MSKDLAALHQRMTELERAIAFGHPPLPKRRLVSALRAGALAVVVGAGCATAARVVEPRGTVILVAPQDSPDPPPEPPGAGELRLVEGVGPSFAAVGAGTANDLILRCWRPSHPEAPLFAVALDRSTYRIRWVSGPWPSEARRPGQLLVTGDVVVVTDSDAQVHLLDVKSGAERGRVKLPRSVSAIHPISGTPSAVRMELLRDHDPGAEGETPRVDVDVLTAVFVETREPVDRAACVTDGSERCRVPLDVAGAALAGLDKTRIYSAYDVRDGADHFGLVSETAGVGPGQIEHMVKLEPRTGRPLWRKTLVPPARRWEPYPNTAPPGETVLTQGLVVHVYPLSDGGHRITAVSLDTGTRLYDAPLPGLDYATKISAMVAEGGEVFFFANRALHAVDAKTGAVTRRVEAL